MRNLLGSVAMALVFSAGAANSQTTPDVMSDHTYNESSDFYASNLIGMRIYATESDVEAAENAAETDEDAAEVTSETTTESTDTAAADGAARTAVGPDPDWEDIGEINDLIVTNNGEVAAVIIGVGGFLGIGEKDVALDMRKIKVVREEDQSRFLVVNATRAMLEEAPAYERDDALPDRASSEEPVSSERVGTDPATADAGDADEPRMDGDRAMLAPPAVEREGYQETAFTELTADELTGAPVYGVDDEEIGEINELILDDQGKVTHAVIAVGGFLGIGEKSVAVTFEELRILREADGDDTRVYIDATESALESQPAYQKG